MARIIPNEKSWIAFSATKPNNLATPDDLEIAAATVLTAYVVSINAQTQGNTVPTPSLASLFETNIPGTVQASFTGDFYRDDADDVAWDTLNRGTVGYFFISRFGGTGTGHSPIVGEHVEVWPVAITARTASAMTNNTVQTFTLTAAVPTEPVENAVVVAN
jgi:hypothetical protein